MKIYNIFLLFVALAVFSCDDDEQLTIDCLPANLASGVVAFYPFNSGALSDESNNGNDITNTTAATPTSDRAGNMSCAYLFDNTQPTEEFLTTANSNFLNNLAAFSVSIWYQPVDPTRDGGAFEVLLGRGDDQIRCPDRNGEWSVALYDCRKVVLGHDNSVWANPITSPTDCEDEVAALTGTWHHVVAVKNNDEYKIYFNGVLEEMETGNAGCTNQYLAQDIGDLFIGKYFTGKIDDVIIYDRELSQAEVTELFELEACCL